MRKLIILKDDNTKSQNGNQILYLKFYMQYWHKLCQVCCDNIRFE